MTVASKVAGATTDNGETMKADKIVSLWRKLGLGKFESDQRTAN